MVPTRNQIVAQVEAVLARDPQARCIAIRSPTAQGLPDSVSVGHRAFRLHWCPSSLAARQALIQIEASPADGVILLTHLSDAALGADTLARLSRGRVFQVERWDMVRQVFQATEIDSRLAAQGWMAQALLEYLPTGGYPPVAGGFLDLETAWKQVLNGSLGLPQARPDLVSLLRWTMAADHVGRFMRLPAQTQPQIVAWLADCAGPVGELVMGCVAAGNAAYALPIGLLWSLVLAPGGVGLPELAAAAVRLERYTGDRRIAPPQGRRWADAAIWLLRSLPEDSARPAIERAEGLLRELHLVGYAGLSDVLPSGFEARLSVFGLALDALLGQASMAALVRVEQAASQVLQHDLGDRPGTRVARVQMALRLARWLVAAQAPGAAPATKASLATGFPNLAQRYATDGAYVDWARIKLLGGDELAALSATYRVLAARVRERREDFNQRFAAALATWNLEPAPAADCLPVESVLEQFLAPLARQAPVLFLVVDGLSLPVFREICADLMRSGWMEQIPADAANARVGIAALPTVTEISRASLLAGRLTAGAAHQEKTAFAAHEGLLAASKSGGKPILFHKGELGEAGGLAEQVRAVIGTATRRVVGLVYNAVDDHLSGSDQLHLRWSLDDLRLLRPLLYEASTAGRTLIITADHGHVIDEQTVQRTAADGDRWRNAIHGEGGPVQADETLLEGGRVCAPNGGSRIVCAWSELLRYSGKKNGYHGGVSPQEVVVPLSVFIPPLCSLDGWKPAPPSQPEWWEDTIRSAVGPPVPVVPKQKRRARDETMSDLFGHEPLGEPPAAQVDWIAALLASPTYRQQRQLAARVAPQDEDVRRLLEALDTRGGKLGKTALAQRLGMPLMRVSGFVNAARRVLNLDQSAVLTLNEVTGQIEFNRELLDVQFQLKTHGV
ncbi:BREX-2 system phosphatase PglZ [uncultured Thiodictyon sp.]|uniref:BREX-2 system phosphatase PglZ n=1 Tax=uncultured Thiodictyon sp. TaxID=1846217 RepID=UPI0025D0E3C8|nr:BREX-2 system phosphatase PglZ [uncultured Thiodictyon sp.]